jgi:hypothetical protein
MAIFPRIRNPYPAAMGAAVVAALALTTAPAAADAATDLILFDAGRAAERANIEYASVTPDGPMPQLPVEYEKPEHDDEGDQASETGAGGS